jgi:hypothetical protein
MDTQRNESSEKVLMSSHEIEDLMPLMDPADKTRMFQTLLKGQALFYFENHLGRKLKAEDSELPDHNLIELVLRDIGIEYIPKRSICVQKHCMRQTRGYYMGLHTSVLQFVERLNDLNLNLLYFLKEHPQHLAQDEIIITLDQS